jgi:class 3 adenylate cyclase
MNTHTLDTTGAMGKDDWPMSAASQFERAAQMLAQARLLVVDDSKMMRMAITRSLTQLGVTQVEQAANGIQALERLRSEAFDLMLLDMEMPEMTGLQVLAHMQEDPHLHSFPVIVISGGQDIDDVVRCIEMGAQDYLPKPFSQVLLKARLTSSIEKKRLRDLEQQQRQQLQQQHEQLALEQGKSEKLLLNILPRAISSRLKSGETRIADAHSEVSVLFADLVGFTQMSKGMSAEHLVQLLDDIFSRFDALVTEAGVEKIKTIGDCYMLVGGVPEPRADHAQAVVQVGLAMLQTIQAFNREHGTELNIRIGVNSGPVVAGVIGMHKFTYDLWGNTVNVASRMESTGTPGRVQVSPSTAAHLQSDFQLEARGTVAVKGIGELATFFVQAHSPPCKAELLNTLVPTPENWCNGLYQACRQLRLAMPTQWPGLPTVLTHCLQSLDLPPLDAAHPHAQAMEAMQGFALAVAHDMETQAGNAAAAPEPAYHNRLHTADVLLALTTLLHSLKASFRDLEPAWAMALLASAVVHDYQHPGGVNSAPAEIESHSWQAAQTWAASLPPVWRETVHTLVLGTEAQQVANNHAQVARRDFQWDLPWCQVLLNEADILLSATAEFGPSLSQALAQEWHKAGFAGHATVATPQGRAQFLQHIQFSSPAAQALHMPEQVQAQLVALNAATS